MGVHLKITVSIYNCDMMMAGIQIFKKAFTTCKKKKKKAEKYPFFLHRMPLEEFPIAVFFFPFRQKVAKS
jgi:hypothetical protein